MLFPALKLSLDGLTDKLRPVFALVQNGLNPLERPRREPSLHVFCPLFKPSHAENTSYELLTVSHMRNITNITY